jgi:hypothetical protein
MQLYCIGHREMEFDPRLPFSFVTPNQNIRNDSIIIEDDRFGAVYSGSILSEYTQLFGVARRLLDAQTDGQLYLFQYRKFISLRTPSLRSAYMPYAFTADRAEAERLFPSADEMASLDGTILTGEYYDLAETSLRTVGGQYAAAHLAEDFAGMVATLSRLKGFSDDKCDRFINGPSLIPAPTLGCFPVDVFTSHMTLLSAVWGHFYRHFFRPRSGYQRRVGGFLLERVHSFLIQETIRDRPDLSHQVGAQVVVSEGPERHVSL